MLGGASCSRLQFVLASVGCSFLSSPLGLATFLPQAVAYGTEEHMQQVWQQLPQSPCFQRRGKQVKMSRGYTWQKVALERLPDWHTYLLILLYMGITKKWWDAASDMPDCAGHTHAAQEPMGEARPTDAARNHDETARGMEQLRAKAANALHLAAVVMGGIRNWKLVKAITTALEPIHTRFNLDLTATKTRMGTKHWYTNMSAGRACSDVSSQLIQKLASANVAASCGFFPGPAGEEDSAIDSYVAEKFFALVLSQLASHAMFTASYSCSLPHKFGALLHEDPAVQQETLRWLKHVWATLCKLEELALDDGACAQFLRELVWPQLHYCREVLITLAERQWQGVPDDLRQHLLGQAIGFAGTKCVEDGFNFSQGCWG